MITDPKKVFSTMSRKSKKAKKKFMFHLSFHRSTSPVNSYSIIPSTGMEGGERTVGMRYHAGLLIANCVD